MGQKIPSLNSKCESFTDCGSCVQNHGCFWCLLPQLKNPLVNVPSSSSILNHCISEFSDDIICPTNYTVNPKTKGEIIENKPLESKNENIVQLKPQKVRLRLKRGESYNLNFQYYQAENYPVDLYYIIDNSYSMRVHKATLASLGTKLAEAMRNKTNNFRIGFGSFIDKVELPYVSTVPEKLASPCPNSNMQCVKPYSFKNHMRLGVDFERFAREVRDAKPSGNLDSPEGGFDAIMQAIVCKEEIGWRPQARHMMMFSTDAQFHIAGDGKLAGVIETNDAKCHLSNNEYDGLTNDYPSISQLNQIAKENNINLIFAIVKSKTSVVKSYKKLSEHIENSKADGLDEGSKNVIKLVVDNYDRIVNSVTMETNSTEDIRVKITPHCKTPIQDGCSNVTLGEIVNFTATITLLKCSENSKIPTVISLKPDAVNESLSIEIESICGCDCEAKTHQSYKVNAKECSNAGDLVCGTCVCKDNNHGGKCECDSSTSQISNETNCIENKPGALTCSGLGICKCGKCECRTNPNTGRKYRGKYCGCDDDSCDKENGKLCGGRGTCSCGTCICDAGLTGPSCGCPDNNRTCIREGYNDLCSGKGACECGKCVCSEKYTGDYCEVCPTCLEKCVNIRDCVECTAFQSGIYNKDQCKVKCVAYNIATTDKTISKRNEEEKICRAIDDKKCEIIYKYSYDDNDNLVILVFDKKKCDPDLLVWALSVVAFILLIGLVTLFIWKIFTSIHDKREYEKFMREQKESRWHTDNNPLYKGATTTFENPHYNH